jgi:hypothetical protein
MLFRAPKLVYKALDFNSIRARIDARRFNGRMAFVPEGQNRAWLLGVERGSPGPKGLKSLAQSLPWVFGLTPEALKHSTRCRLLMPGGRPPADEAPRTYSEMPVALQGASRWGVSQGKPWAKLSWPVGPKTRPYPHPSSRVMSKLQSRHFVPGYDQSVPPGQKPFACRSA